MAAVVTSETEVCNIVLSLLGADEIENLSEESKEAMICSRQYGRLRDAVLRSHPWNFAVRRASLAAESGVTPSFEYTYQFPLPADYLRMIRTEAESLGYDDDYRIESTATGNKLLSNDSTVKIEYIAQVTNVALWDAAFVDVLTARMAAEIAFAITDNATLAENMRTIYADKLREARNTDAQEGVPREISRSGWVDGIFA